MSNLFKCAHCESMVKKDDARKDTDGDIICLDCLYRIEVDDDAGFNDNEIYKP